MKAKNFLIVAAAAGLMPAALIAQQSGGDAVLLKGRLEKQLAEISALDAEIQSLSQLLGREGTPLPRREPAKPAPPPEVVPETPVVPAPTTEVKPPVTPPAPEPQVRTAIPVDEPATPPRVAPPAVVAVPTPPTPVPVPPAPPAPPTLEPPTPPVLVPPPDVPVPPVELPKPGPPTLVDQPDPVLPAPLPNPATTSSNGKEYTVQAGDSFSSIARKTKVSVSALIKANPNVVPEKLQLGQKLQMPTAADMATTTAAALPRAPAPVPEPPDAPVTPRAEPPPPPAVPGGYHVIQSGDTLHGIAQRSGTTVEAISKLNGITNPAALKIGTKLKLPPGSKNSSPPAAVKTENNPSAPIAPRPSTPGSHVVKPGETLYSISRQTGTPIEELRKVNGLKEDTIHPGQSLKVRRNSQSPGAAEPKPTSTPVIKPAKPVTSIKSTITPVAKASQGNGVQMAEYTVAYGDSLFTIARRHFLSREELAAINSLPVDLPLQAGQKIRLPIEAISSREMAENESKAR